MAAFIAKQMIGSKLDSVKGIFLFFNKVREFDYFPQLFVKIFSKVK